MLYRSDARILPESCMKTLLNPPPLSSCSCLSCKITAEILQDSCNWCKNLARVLYENSPEPPPLLPVLVSPARSLQEYCKTLVSNARILPESCMKTVLTPPLLPVLVCPVRLLQEYCKTCNWCKNLASVLYKNSSVPPTPFFLFLFVLWDYCRNIARLLWVMQ